MTWGIQNTEAEGHEQMSYSLDRGVSFWDTAEIYPIPPAADSMVRGMVLEGVVCGVEGEAGKWAWWVESDHQPPLFPP